MLLTCKLTMNEPFTATSKRLMMTRRKRKQPFRVMLAVELSLQKVEEQYHQRKCKKDGEFSGGSREKEKDKKENEVDTVSSNGKTNDVTAEKTLPPFLHTLHPIKNPVTNPSPKAEPKFINGGNHDGKNVVDKID